MAVGDIQSKVKSFFRPGLEKRRRSSNSSSRSDSKRPKNELASAATDNGSPELNLQLSSPLFRDLPIEIRKIVYSLVWLGPWDDQYYMASGAGRHIHFSDGHWSNTRCVMYEDDEDLDFIQKNSTVPKRFIIPLSLFLLWVCPNSG